MFTPQMWPETPSRLRARAVLVHAVQDPALDLDAQLAALSAIGELQDYIPHGYLLAPVDPMPGTLTDAFALLAAAAHEDVRPDDDLSRLNGSADADSGRGAEATVRDRLAVGLAAAHLRRWVASTPSGAAEPAGPGR
ncbi:hypothetical protein [Kineosporia sp. A_224]|uniref:hypothetical protein n=1 Tax=Kineosporia sp. A_224 TaxID=1962180 RepID=UPI000B4B8651|nr:hypothetical protein [Kineosporia sp. A_224]